MSEDGIADAIAEAKEELSKAVEEKEEVKEDEVREEKVEEEVVEEEVEEEGLDEHLTAEDLEKINDNPETLKAYKSMQRGLTKKTTELADERKSLEKENEGLREGANIAAWIEKNPEAAYLALEKHLIKEGKLPDKEKLEIKDAESETIDEIMELAEKRLQGNKEAAKLLAPFVRDVAKLVAKQVVSEEIKPLREDNEETKNERMESQARTEINKFGQARISAGDEWDDDIINGMAELMNEFPPGPNSDPQTYFDILYGKVVGDTIKTESKRERLRRLKAAKKSEPVSNLKPSDDEPQKITPDMDDKEAFKLAVAQATAELK